MKTIKELVVIVVALGAGCVLTVGFLSLAYFCTDVTVYTPLVLLFVAALALAAASPADAKAIAISMSTGPALTFSFLFLQLLFEGRGFVAWGCCNRECCVDLWRCLDWTATRKINKWISITRVVFVS